MKRKHWKIIIITLLLLVSLPVLVAFIAFTFYKKEISNLIIKQLRDDYGLEVKIQEIRFSFTESWPNATIYLQGTDLQTVSGKAEPFFTANQIGLSFNLKKLLQKEFLVNSVSVKDGVIQLLVDSAGTNNYTFLKQKDTVRGGSNVKFDIKKLKLENVRFHFINKRLRKSIAFNFKNVIVHPYYFSNAITANLQGDMFFNQLLFKPGKGPFMYNKPAQVDLNISWFKDLKSVYINHNSLARIENQFYNLSAFIEYKEKPAKLSLKITGKALDAGKTIKLLNNSLRRVLLQFNLENPVNADILIVAYLGKQRDPEIVATVEGKNNKLAIGDSKIPYDNVSFTGRVICVAEKGKEPDMKKGKIIFKNVKGNIYQFPFTANILINNLESPRIIIKGEIKGDVSKFDFEKNDKIKLKGNCYANILYTGPTRYVNKREFLNDSMQLNADFHFRNVAIKPGTRTPEYILNGVAKVNNDNLKFHRLIFKTKGGNVFLSGEAIGFTEYACGLSKGFKGIINASTDYLDITPLLVKDENKKPKNYSKELKQMKKSNFSFNIALKARQLRFRQFNAYSTDAQINYTNSDVIIPRLKLNAAEGVLTGKAWLEDFTGLTANINLKDMNVNTLFQECENFSQKAITDKNLKGIVSATVNVNCELNEYFSVDPGSMAGKLKVKVNNGHLINYEPLQNISKFIFRNRNFEDITFTEINETFDVKGTEMTINDFELASNVINLFLNGKYNFRGESNINMRIPWSNLKKRGENYVPRNLGENGKDAKGLKLNYHGPSGKMKLGLGNK